MLSLPRTACPPVGMVQAWLAKKIVNVTFYKFFDVTFYKYLRRFLVKTCNRNECYKNKLLVYHPKKVFWKNS